jgi:hypothetical protein
MGFLFVNQPLTYHLHDRCPTGEEKLFTRDGLWGSKPGPSVVWGHECEVGEGALKPLGVGGI